MKNNLQTNPVLLKLTILVACFMLVIVYNKSKAAEVREVMHQNSQASVTFVTGVEQNELTPCK